jgi:hypothetical protein
MRAEQVNSGAEMAGNNCVLCTVGGSSRPRLTPSDAAANAHVNEGGPLVGQQTQALTENGLGDGHAAAFTDWTAAGRFMRNMPRGTRFAISYRHAGSIGHTIAAERGRWLGHVRYRDYHSNEARYQPDAHMSAAVSILVFPLNHQPSTSSHEMILNAAQLTPAQRSEISRSQVNDGNAVSGWKLLQDRMADGAARGRRILQQRTQPASAARNSTTSLDLDTESSPGGALPTPRSARPSSPTPSTASTPPYHPAWLHEGALSSLGRPMRMDSGAFHHRPATTCGK